MIHSTRPYANRYLDTSTYILSTYNTYSSSPRYLKDSQCVSIHLGDILVLIGYTWIPWYSLLHLWYRVSIHPTVSPIRYVVHLYWWTGRITTTSLLGTTPLAHLLEHRDTGYPLHYILIHTSPLDAPVVYYYMHTMRSMDQRMVWRYCTISLSEVWILSLTMLCTILCIGVHVLSYSYTCIHLSPIDAAVP